MVCSPFLVKYNTILHSNCFSILLSCFSTSHFSFASFLNKYYKDVCILNCIKKVASPLCSVNSVRETFNMNSMLYSETAGQFSAKLKLGLECLHHELLLFC